ncbi:SirB2 family protein [Undibacterium sp. Ji49W]|uniref:SirB2 family protein n=1 Tax=Undibacterium sp. Ji49W TaxID=3413040 RepID=UPI003BF13C5E
MDMLPSYVGIKHLHMTCAALSGSLFLLRGIWMLRSSSMLTRRWVRILPHVIDTILLASALTLAMWSGQYPFRQDWLTAKLLALILYIVLGTVALKRGKTPAIRAVALVAALLVFAYIVSVALTRQVLPL